MNAEVITEAAAKVPDDIMTPARPAIILVDGISWSSCFPSNPGEAQSCNNDAREIVARLKGAK